MRIPSSWRRSCDIVIGKNVIWPIKHDWIHFITSRLHFHPLKIPFLCFLDFLNVHYKILQFCQINRNGSSTDALAVNRKLESCCQRPMVVIICQWGQNIQFLSFKSSLLLLLLLLLHLLLLYVTLLHGWLYGMSWSRFLFTHVMLLLGSSSCTKRQSATSFGFITTVKTPNV